MGDAYYSQAVHGPYQTHDLGDFVLEGGGKIRGLRLAFATFGTLNAEKSNAILFPTWYSGTSKILEEAYVGPGRALDPSRYFIVLVNQIGNGLSSSPSNTSSPFDGPRFPRPSIGDDVEAQRRLLVDLFGIERLALVLGGSMGAQQAWEWAVRFPQGVARIAPIAGTAKATTHNQLLVDGFIEAITCDPSYARGLVRRARSASGSASPCPLVRHIGIQPFAIQSSRLEGARLYHGGGFSHRLCGSAFFAARRQ